MGLHFGGFGVNRSVLFAGEPLSLRVNPLIRTSTPRCAPGRRCLRAGHQVNVRARGPGCRSSGPRARKGTCVGLRCFARADCVAVTAIVRGRGGSWARLLAVLTLQCAAKPHWWHGGQPAQVATSRVNVRMKGPRPPPAGPKPPPIGLACEVKGVSAQDAFTETQEGLTARRRPDALYMTRETTEAGPRRNPHLVAYGGCAVGAEKSTFQQHDLSILIVGPNQLKYRLSRTRKPKSHPTSNTKSPINLTLHMRARKPYASTWGVGGSPGFCFSPAGTSSRVASPSDSTWASTCRSADTTTSSSFDSARATYGRVSGLPA